MKRHILIADADEKPFVYFDTGLDPRAFARTKMSQSLIESGFVVHPDGSHEVWKAAGVNDKDGVMRVWGPLFNGKRLDMLLDSVTRDSQGKFSGTQQETLQAVVSWIRAKMFLGETQSTLNPGAAIVCDDEKDGAHPNGSVFFAPEHLSSRCLFIEGKEIDNYNCPDLTGIDASAFCAGLMLYKTMTGTHPYPSADIFQDMREGVFLPVNLTAPDLDEKLSDIIQAALLLPVEKRRPSESGIDILSSILKILTEKENLPVAASSFYKPLAAGKMAQVEKEKKSYLFKQNSVVRTKRFIIRNKYPLMGAALGIIFILFIVITTAKTSSRRWTTEGLSANHVVLAYYDAFSSLDHVRMEACIQGADRSDIDTAAGIFAVAKTRQAYESSTIMQARVLKELGRELPSPDAFGTTDMTIKQLSGGENESMVIYSVDYLLWSPVEDYAISRNDILTLRRDKRKNWRIVEILRTEQ